MYAYPTCLTDQPKPKPKANKNAAGVGASVYRTQAQPHDHVSPVRRKATDAFDCQQLVLRDRKTQASVTVCEEERKACTPSSSRDQCAANNKGQYARAENTSAVKIVVSGDRQTDRQRLIDSDRQRQTEREGRTRGRR